MTNTNFTLQVRSKYQVQAMPTFMQKLNLEFSKIMREQKFHALVLKDKKELRHDGESDDDVLTRAFDELYPEWMRDLESRGKFHGDQLEIYRGISAKDINDINFNKLGVYWTWDKKWAANYSDHNTKLPLTVMTTLISVPDIDFKETLRKIVWEDNLDESEREITLKPNIKLKIIDPIKKEAKASPSLEI